jgi:hypothetical protein
MSDAVRGRTIPSFMSGVRTYSFPGDEVELDELLEDLRI